MAGTVSVQFNSAAITGAQDVREQVNSRVNEVIIPRKDGSEHETTPKAESRIISVNGIIHGASADAVRTTLDTLLLNLNSGTHNLTILNDRQISAVKRNFDYSWGRNAKTIEYSIEFVAKDPFWSATSTANDTANTSSPTTVTPGGSAPTYPVIAITASVTQMNSITLANGNTSVASSFTYSGVIVTTKVLTIDCGAKTVMNDGASDLANFSGDFWPLAGGVANVITVTKTGGNYSIDFTWYNKW